MSASTWWENSCRVPVALRRVLQRVGVFGLLAATPLAAQSNGPRVSDDRLREFGRQLAQALTAPNTGRAMRAMLEMSARTGRVIRENTWRVERRLVCPSEFPQNSCTYADRIAPDRLAPFVDALARALGTVPGRIAHDSLQAERAYQRARAEQEGMQRICSHQPPEGDPPVILTVEEVRQAGDTLQVRFSSAQWLWAAGCGGGMTQETATWVIAPGDAPVSLQRGVHFSFADPWPARTSASIPSRSAPNGPRPPVLRGTNAAWDLSLGLASQTSGVGDNASLGLTLQWVHPWRQYLRVGAQGGAHLTMPTGDICYLLPNGSCEREVPSTLHLAPLVGVGYAVGPAEVRVMAGPRIVAASERPFAGTQVTADLALGSPRVSLLVPITWALTRSTDRRFDNRSVGIGLRFR